MEDKISNDNVTTSIDALFKMVIMNGKVQLGDISKSLNLPEYLVEKWARTLHKKKLIKIKYNIFGSPHLIAMDYKKPNGTRVDFLAQCPKGSCVRFTRDCQNCTHFKTVTGEVTVGKPHYMFKPEAVVCMNHSKFRLEEKVFPNKN